MFAYTAHRAFHVVKGEKEKKEAGKSRGGVLNIVRSQLLCLSLTAHTSAPSRWVVRRTQVKHPAQGAALIGLAPLGLTFFPASAGICIMSEVVVEMTFPSSALT